jgi:hypothetical protein
MLLLLSFSGKITMGVNVSPVTKVTAGLAMVSIKIIQKIVFQTLTCLAVFIFISDI